MKLLQIIGIIGATTIIAVFPLGKDASAKPAAFEREMMLEWQRFLPSGDPSEASRESLQDDSPSQQKDTKKLEEAQGDFSVRDYSADANGTSDLPISLFNPMSRFQLPKSRQKSF